MKVYKTNELKSSHMFSKDGSVKFCFKFGVTSGGFFLQKVMIPQEVFGIDDASGFFLKRR